MSDIQKYLDESKNNIRDLVAEIEKFKSARILNEKATNALLATTNALDIIHKKIEPFQTQEIRKFLFIFLGLSILNALLLAAVLALTIFK